MFQLSWKELERSRSQLVALNETGRERRLRGQNVKDLPLGLHRTGCGDAVVRAEIKASSAGKR
jgi:hypothetical protein